jgi:hypothetical protein
MGEETGLQRVFEILGIRIKIKIRMRRASL